MKQMCVHILTNKACETNNIVWIISKSDTT